MGNRREFLQGSAVALAAGLGVGRIARAGAVDELGARGEGGASPSPTFGVGVGEFGRRAGDGDAESVWK